MSKFKLGLIQFDIDLGKVKENIARAKALISEAKKRGADMVLLPELWAMGYDLPNIEAHAYPLGEGIFAEVGEIAAKEGLFIAGSLIAKDGDRLYNIATLHNPQGKVILTYSKTHLFPLMKEGKYFAPGESLPLVETPFGKIAFAICFDLRFPELFRSYALAGAEIILLPAEWPRERIEHFELLLRARAVENQYFVAGVNRVGISGKFTFPGCSQVVAPDGKVIARLGDGEGVIVAEIDLEEIRKVREALPTLENRRRELYQL